MESAAGADIDAHRVRHQFRWRGILQSAGGICRAGVGLAGYRARIGLVFAAGAVGSLIASLSLPWLAKRFSPAGITLASLFPNVLLGFALRLRRAGCSGCCLYLAPDVLRSHHH